MHVRWLTPLAVLTWAACAGGSSSPATPDDPSQSAGEFDANARAFYDAEMAVNDGAQPDRSPDAVRAEIGRLEAAIERFTAYDDASLMPVQRAERAAIIARAHRGLLELERHGDSGDAALLGTEGLEALLAAEGLDVELDEVRAVAEAALAEAREELVSAAEEIDPGMPVAEVLGFERMNKPAPEELLPVAEQQLGEVRELAEQAGLVSIPEGVEVEVLAAPPQLRDRHAALRAPDPREREPRPAAFYLAPPDDSWSQEEQEGYVLSIGDLLVASIREVWPGRLVHALAAAQSESDILASFCPEATRGGWAHYAEGLMWEAGLADGEPRVHAVILASEIQRLLRVLTVLDLHTGGITVQEAEARFVEGAFIDTASARQEAARALNDPWYVGEALGRLAIETLRRDWMAQEGGDPLDFHESFLAQACAPLPAIRAALLGPDDTGPVLSAP